jgi:hypothetical protein
MEIFTKYSAKCTIFQRTICNKFSSLMSACRSNALFVIVAIKLPGIPFSSIGARVLIFKSQKTVIGVANSF